MSTRTISTLNAATQARGKAASLIIDASHPVKIIRIEGYITGTANTQIFLQLHSVVPTNGVTAPLRTLQALELDGFTFDYGKPGLDTQELASPLSVLSTGTYLYLSSTQSVFTAPVDGAVMDCQVEIEEYAIPVPGVSTAGDTTSNVASQLVWASAGGAAHRLVDIQAKNNSGATQYLMLFSTPPTAGDYPLMQWQVADGVTLKANFGSDTQVQGQETTTTYANTYGCYLYVSSTKQVFTAPVGTPWNIMAHYL